MKLIDLMLRSGGLLRTLDTEYNRIYTYTQFKDKIQCFSHEGVVCSDMGGSTNLDHYNEVVLFKLDCHILGIK